MENIEEFFEEVAKVKTFAPVNSDLTGDWKIGEFNEKFQTVELVNVVSNEAVGFNPARMSGLGLKKFTADTITIDSKDTGKLALTAFAGFEALKPFFGGDKEVLKTQIEKCKNSKQINENTVWKHINKTVKM